MSEKTILRMNILGGMNQDIINLGDEEIWLEWIALGVPDEATEEDLQSVAEDDELYFEVCEIYAKCVKNF